MPTLLIYAGISVTKKTLLLLTIRYPLLVLLKQSCMGCDIIPYKQNCIRNTVVVFLDIVPS